MISAKIIADSISPDKVRITTFELEYPRFIHSELMTHRLFSRNAASSRAIPIDKMIDQVLEAPAMPAVWGLNQSGMQSKDFHKNVDSCVYVWRKAAQRAVESARELQEQGLHKQIVNRVLEPFQLMKTVVTATEFDNFFYLRCHKDAQPEIEILANLMYETYNERAPRPLEANDWHLPYFGAGFWSEGYGYDYDIDLETAQKISASCCAQVSFRLQDDSVVKACKIYDTLVSNKPVHASPFEHQASPISLFMEEDLFGGVTHMDEVYNTYWSGNFRGWIQYRQLIKDNVCYDYEERDDG